MSVIEAAYEFRNVADIFVVSQEVVSLDGWDYKDLLTRLAHNPQMTPVDLSRGMVDSFRSYYANSSYTDQDIAALALNMKYSSDGKADIGTLAGKVNDLALRLSARMADSRDPRRYFGADYEFPRVMPVQKLININVDLVDFGCFLVAVTLP